MKKFEEGPITPINFVKNELITASHTRVNSACFEETACKNAICGKLN